MELVCRGLMLALAGVLSACAHERPRSPEDIGLRPADEEELDVFRIPEPAGRQYDPQPHDLDETMLRQRLGHNFDPTYMAVTEPARRRHNHSASFEFPFRRNGRGRLVPTSQEMPHSIKKLNLKYFQLPNGTKVRTNYSTKFRKKLQQFLWAFTSCPVLHEWRDLGVRFWPRYLRMGRCSDEASCSIPPGMKCRRAGTVFKTLLRWQCHKPHQNVRYSTYPTDIAPTLQCQWIEINNIPILTRCACACPELDKAQH